MKSALTNFLLLTPQNLPIEVYVGVAMGYLALLLLFLLDIASSRLGRLTKTLWFLAVIALPFLGMYAYALFWLVKADYAPMRRFGFGKVPASR